MPERHLGVAEAKRRFSDVLDQVVHHRQRFVIERHGRPVAVIGPIEDTGALRPGQRLAAIAGTGGPEAEEFRESMQGVIEGRRRRLPRPLPEIPE